MLNKTLVIIFAIVAFLGFGDATYLTVQHFLAAPVPCSIINGCETVLTSSWSVILGVPVALLGALYYLGMLVLSILYLDTKNTRLGCWLPRLTIAGLLASIYFVGLQLFVIKAICLYCMGSALTSTALFIMVILMVRKPTKHLTSDI